MFQYKTISVRVIRVRVDIPKISIIAPGLILKRLIEDRQRRICSLKVNGALMSWLDSGTHDLMRVR